MCPQDVDPDPLPPPDPLDVMRGEMNRMLCDLGIGGAGDVNTIKRRALVGRFEELASGVVAIHQQRQVQELRRELDAAFDASVTQMRVIRALAKALAFYADARNWQAGCPVRVNAFNLRDIQLDWGECARDALRFLRSAGVLPR